MAVVLRLLRGIPAVLVALVGSLVFSVGLAPSAAVASDAPAMWWGKTVQGRIWGQFGDGSKAWSDTYILPRSGMVRAPITPVRRPVVATKVPTTKADAQVASRFVAGAVNRDAAAALLARAASGVAGAMAQAPTLNTLTEIEGDLGLGEWVRDNVLEPRPSPGAAIFAGAGRPAPSRFEAYCGYFDQIASVSMVAANEMIVEGLRIEAVSLGQEGGVKCPTPVPTTVGGEICMRADGSTAGVSAYHTLLEPTGMGDNFGESPFRWRVYCQAGAELIGFDLGTRGKVEPDADGRYPKVVRDGGIAVMPGKGEKFQQWLKDNTVQAVTIECKDAATGSVSTITSKSAPGAMNADMPTCGEGQYPISLRTWVDSPLSSPANDVDLGKIEFGPEAADYPECIGAGAGECQMTVSWEGRECAYAIERCRDWFGNGQDEPWAPSCKWGPYDIPWPSCVPLRHKWATPGETITADPTLPGYYPPVPADPVTGAPITDYPGKVKDPKLDPVTSTPKGCDPGAGGVGGVSTMGLQPVALEGLNCIKVTWPDIVFTSGYRDVYNSPNSCHPLGLGVDVSVAGWDTPAGAARMWEIAGGIASRAGIWEVSYVIHDNKIFYPGAGWKDYTYTGPATGADAAHTNHVHVCFGPAATPQTGTPTTTYPTPENPDPQLPPGSNPVPPGGGGPELDGQNCDGSDLTWSPESWIIVPLKCLFIPETDLGAKLADAGGGFADTGLGSWMTVPAGLGSWVGSQDGGPCEGPAWTFSTKFSGTTTLYPLAACESPVSTLAAIVKASLRVGLSLALVMGMVRMGSAAIGLQRTIERTEVKT